MAQIHSPLDQGDPLLFIDAGQCGELQHPKDFQPNSHIGVVACPLMNRHATPGVRGCPYAAVGMQRALDSAIGLPSRSTSASRMLVFMMPAEVRRNFMLPL